jgi:hypothetical protein
MRPPCPRPPILALFTALLAGCGDGDPPTPPGAGTGGITPGPDDDIPPAPTAGAAVPDGSSGGESSTGEAVKYDVAGDGCESGSLDATLTGTVMAPNLTIPIRDALVYTAAAPPASVPDRVYCAECDELPCGVVSTRTGPDGGFSLPARPGARYLVVQKGQFMRVTPLVVDPGSQALDVEVTSLPGRRDEGAGLYIPNIALAVGQFDRLEDALAKLGLADTLVEPDLGREEFVEGTQQFDLWQNAPTPYATLGTIAELLTDEEALSRYHILFVPCSSDGYLGTIESELAVGNLRRWVAAGGRLYVADWSHEILEAAFDDYQSFYTDKDNGTGDLQVAFDSLGTIVDPALLAWLAALPAALKDINPDGGPDLYPAIDSLPQLQTVDNFSGLQPLPPVLVDDGAGGLVDVGHRPVILGPGDGAQVPASPNPLTVTAQYGCGKLLFTTYHMAQFSDSYVGLTPQELVLLYLILEIGGCQRATEPPL